MHSPKNTLQSSGDLTAKEPDDNGDSRLSQTVALHVMAKMMYGLTVVGLCCRHEDTEIEWQFELLLIATCSLRLVWLAALGIGVAHWAAEADSISQLSQGQAVSLHHKLIYSQCFLQWPAPVCGKCLYSQRQMPSPAQVVNGLLAKALATLDCLFTQQGGRWEPVKACEPLIYGLLH